MFLNYLLYWFILYYRMIINKILSQKTLNNNFYLILDFLKSSKSYIFILLILIVSENLIWVCCIISNKTSNKSRIVNLFLLLSLDARLWKNWNILDSFLLYCYTRKLIINLNSVIWLPSHSYIYRLILLCTILKKKIVF